MTNKITKPSSRGKSRSTTPRNSSRTKASSFPNDTPSNIFANGTSGTLLFDSRQKQARNLPSDISTGDLLAETPSRFGMQYLRNITPLFTSVFGGINNAIEGTVVTKNMRRGPKDLSNDAAPTVRVDRTRKRNTRESGIFVKPQNEKPCSLVVRQALLYIWSMVGNCWSFKVVPNVM